MAALLALHKAEKARFKQAEDALVKGRPNILDPLCDKPLNNPWNFPPSFAWFFAPASSSRAFFVIHEHDATAYHWDLRLQCSLTHGKPGTLSWAIPKGFDEWTKGESRLAIQTSLHSVGYSAFEGVQPPFGCSLIADFGTYSIKTSQSAKRKGKDRERDTPELEGDSAIGTAEEEALAQGFRKNGFAIELHGMRYSIRLAMHYLNTISGGSSGHKRQWIAQLSPRDDGSYLNMDHKPTFKNTSIISGRTMEEVKQTKRPLFLPELSDPQLDKPEDIDKILSFLSSTSPKSTTNTTAKTRKRRRA